MRILDRFFGREQRARTSIGTDSTYLAEWFGQRRGGAPVNPDQVMTNLAVAVRCVGLRSEMLASVGLHLFLRTADGGRERASDNPLYGVLHDLWNPDLSAFEGRELLIRSLDLYGNGLARIERNSRGQVTALYPLIFGEVSIERLPSGRLRYRHTLSSGGSVVLLQDEVLHVRGPSRDGAIGVSPIQLARGACSLGIAQSETARAFAENAARPSGAFVYPEKLAFKSKEDRDVWRERLEGQYKGPSAAGQFMILDGGAKYEPFRFSSEDLEFLDSRRLANLDVARIFGCPPTTVGIPDHGTYSNQEQEATALVRNALGPLAARIESALARCLLTDSGRRSLYVEHDLNALLRGDVKARFEAYRIGREIGAMSPNDIRRRENEPPIPGGEIYHQPANWVPLGSQAQPGQGA